MFPDFSPTKVQLHVELFLTAELVSFVTEVVLVLNKLTPLFAFQHFRVSLTIISLSHLSTDERRHQSDAEQFTS